MSRTLRHQAERLYGTFSDLVRRYQFRDRDQICCHGLTVSQCYTLEVLSRGQATTMGELAAQLCLKISSMTRVVDFLVAGGLATRREDPADRRVCRVAIADKGLELLTGIRGGLVREYEQVLESVPAESREAVIQAVEHLLKAFELRKCCIAENEKAFGAPSASLA